MQILIAHDCYPPYMKSLYHNIRYSALFSISKNTQQKVDCFQSDNIVSIENTQNSPLPVYISNFDITRAMA